jgi:lysyl-tRNA synthetase class 2
MIYHNIRHFFFERNVLELDVPVLSDYATVDPFIESLSSTVMGQQQYLQTSPEFFLKRFLSAHAHDVYYLGKAFRQDEYGARHRPEFTMLEWYRMGINEQALMAEVRALIMQLCPDASWQCLSYGELFQQHLSLNPHTASVSELKACAVARIDMQFDADDKSPWLDVLFTHCIEPQLPQGLVGIYDYPASQAALAKIDLDTHGQLVAKRFEMYLNGMELANGYWELTDADEQERRFRADQHYRQQRGLPVLPCDELLLVALQEGQFPACAGVALGVDRLLMCCLGSTAIDDVISF